MQKKTQKYLNYTKEEIEEYLENVRDLIKKNKFKISDVNREKNVDFIQKYRLSSRKQKEMLLSIETLDFCYAVDDYNTSEKLYIFSKEYELDNWGTYEKINVYIKINVKKLISDEYAIIISFHEREKEINFLFK